MSELPSNCILNKGITGCGATTVAIEQDRPTIIAVPSIGLIQNKTPQHPEVLGIYGEGDKTAEIKNHLESSKGRIKIMVTWDSLPKACRILQEAGFEVYREAQLMVDECHQLMLSYDYRREAIRGLLAEAKRFKDAVYVSATPLAKECRPKQLEAVKEYRIEWPEAKPTQIVTYELTDPVGMAAYVCKRLLSNNSATNYHVFLNSVEDITVLIKLASLTAADTRVICADNVDNKIKLSGFPISTTSDAVRKVNLYTSTAFEGFDIYDKEGYCIVVSDAAKDHTLLDVAVLRQIAGRLRDSRYKDTVAHFYSRKSVPVASAAQFQAQTKADWAGAEQVVAVLDAVLEMLENSKASFGTDTEAEKAKAILDKAESAVTEAVNTGKYIYRDKESGRFIVDADMLQYEAMRYRIINEVYTTKQNMDNELATGGFVIKGSKRLDIGKLADPRGKKPPFKELFEMYAKEMGQRKLYFCPINVKTVIEQQNPFVKEAYEKLGVEGVRRLNYHLSNIKRKILRQ